MKTLLLLVACACPLAVAETETAAQAPAIWQNHELDFTFMGFTSHYSCDGLADKMRLLLVTAGARPDAKATPGNCIRFDRPDPFARVHLRFATLAPISGDGPAGSNAADAKAAGNGAAAGETVAGSWRTVRFAEHRPYDLGAGDCELVEQFKKTVLTNFTTRNVSSGPSCLPHETTVGQPNLSFEVLAPPAPDKGEKAAR
jgi:hypothetical protein